MSLVEEAEHFRAWLVERVIGTRFASMGLDDSNVDKFAALLGVHPDVLLEARAEARIERHKRGIPSPKLTHAKPAAGEAHHRLYQYHLYMPELIFKAWKDECVFRDVDGPVLLRSLIHSYLIGGREPEPRKHWYWRGKRYRMGDVPIRKKFFQLATMPLGAKRALTRRAMLRGTIPTPIVRGLVMEVLEGGHRSLPLIETTMMFDDEERYLRGI